MNKSKSFNKRVKVSNKANKKREPQVYFSCWELRPKWNFPLGFFKRTAKKEPVKTGLVASIALIINVFVQAIYFITLPISFINELIREIKL